MPQLQNPTPFGAVAAGKEVATIAAPLLTAAALSLSGVVASVEPKYFKWPGATLLALILASLLLLASIELHFHGRQYLYSRADMEDWLAPGELVPENPLYRHYCIWQSKDFIHGSRLNELSALCFNLGVLLLGVGVAIVLVPADSTHDVGWRWAAFALAMAGIVLDALWTGYLYLTRASLVKQRLFVKSAINIGKPQEPPAEEES
jgi:hypothetical protein